jgi:hypothetical protein
MKIAINVTRAEQVMNLDTGAQETFLIAQLATGLEIKVPCTEQQLAEVVAAARRQNSSSDNPNTGIPERIYTYNAGQESTETGEPLPLGQQSSVGAPANPNQAVSYAGPFQSAAELEVASVAQAAQVPVAVAQVAMAPMKNPLSSASPVSRPRQPMADDAGIGQG